MIAYFPELYPDELVYSWFCRYYVHAGFPTHKIALQELYCKRSDDPSKEFIGNLNADARSFIQRLCPFDSLVLEHTMFPQYARFIPTENQKAALYRLCHEACDPHHLFPILPRTGDEQYLRFCPVCAEEDRQKYGETYWHRKHQIRNAQICPRHYCKLERSDIPAKSEHSDAFYPAELHIRMRKAIYEANPTTIRFSSYLEEVFDTSIDFKNIISTADVLGHGLQNTPYLIPSGKSRNIQKLSDDLRQYYEPLGLCNIATMNQIQRVLSGSRHDFSVVCQLAFFLGMTAQELVSPSLLPVKTKKHHPKAAPVDWIRLDAEKVPELERLAKELYTGNSEHRPERISERLVYRELGLLKHQLDKLPRCRAVCERYAESYPELWARRLIWAYRKLQTEHNGPIYWSDIRSLAGVKRKNIIKTLPYIAKHADRNTAVAITQLAVREMPEPVHK